MGTGTTGRRAWAAVSAVAVLATTMAATACDPLDDAEPTVPSVDFAPRLVVTVDDDGITAAAGPREGAEVLAGSGDGDWRVTTGSVTELGNEASGARRVVITVTPLEGPDDDPTPWLDSGSMEPGESTVIALSSPGVYHYDDVDRGGDGSVELTVQVVPRSAP